MSQVLILAVGHKPPAWVSEACADYLGRFGRRLKVELKEIPPSRRGPGAAAAALAQEDAVLLEPRGQMLDAEGLAAALAGWLMRGSPLALLIGGADGFGPQMLARAPTRWSLSALTFPHMLARVMVLEQLYRAFSLLHNLPYHREH